jgi:hypothetical protein
VRIAGIRKFSAPNITIGQWIAPLSSASIQVVTNPSNATILQGTTTTFYCSGVASDSLPVSYAWQRSFNNSYFYYIPGATSNVYATSAAAITDNNSFFRCALSAQGIGLVYTNSAVLSVYATPSIPNYIGWYVIQ